MTDTVFCYHCKRHHPRNEMRQIESGGRKRWRCVQSIEATKSGRAAREAFGRATTLRNRDYWSACAKVRYEAKSNA